MSMITTLSVSQLRQAANIKEKLEALVKRLNHLLSSPTKTVATKASKIKIGLSIAGKAKIAAAQKARWARINAPKVAVKPAKKKSQMSAAAKAKLSALAKASWAKVKAGGDSNTTGPKKSLKM